MSYLIYNGKRVISDSKYIWGIPPENIGKILWDGVDDYVSFASDPSVSGSKKIEFYLKIDSNFPSDLTISNQNADIIRFEKDQNDILKLGLYPNSGNIAMDIIVNTSSSLGKSIDLTAYKGQEILIEVIKSTNSVVSAKINGNTQTLNNLNNIWSGFPRYQIGPRGFSPTSVSTFLVWDIKLYTDPDTTNTLMHHWAGYGYPLSSINNSWIDQVGSLDGTVYGSPAITAS